VHLDIALMNPWSQPGRQEEFHLLSDLNDAIELRRKSFSQQDIEQRAGAALELASRHGITHLRAQCHLDTEIGLSHIKALQHVKEAYAGRVTIQIVAFPQQGFWRNPGTLDLYREAFRIGADVMGCASNLDYDESGYVDFKKHIDTAFDLAMELDVDLDIHADLGIPQSITLEELEIVHIARKTIETGYQGRVTAGHVCALDSALPEVAQQVIQLILEAGISVVSQPDLYRLGREDTHNTRRGLTRVKELLAAGVNVTFASNNVRDALRPMGNLDPLEEALILSYGAHMDTIEEFNTLLKMCTYHGAKALGVQNYGLEPGCNADLVVLDACSPSAAIVGQVEKNYVFKAGQLMASSWVKSEIFNGTQLQEVQNY
ncbi:MAG: amidohydrolase family protein, partial [Anaerolineales bacterium]|nr:amidohydrolase family protein [Anaerolineales bacterium]